MNAAAELNLTATEVTPNAAGALMQLSDGLLGGKAGTDQRVFANSDHTLAIESDVIIETAQPGVTSDYAQASTAAKGRVANLSGTKSPSIGDQATEFAGTTSDSKSIVAIVFTRHLTVDAVLIESTGAVDPAYVEQVATALDQKIQSSG